MIRLSAWLGLVLATLLFFGLAPVSAAQSYYFSWSCINARGCADLGIPSSGREGPYSSATQCNTEQSQMASAGGFNVQNCSAVGLPAQTTPTAPAPNAPITEEDMAPVRPRSIPLGQDLNTYCALAQGVIRGSTREWNLGCCPRSHPILKSSSPTIQCGTEEARQAGIECSCYRQLDFCLQASTLGFCY